MIKQKKEWGKLKAEINDSLVKQIDWKKARWLEKIWLFLIGKRPTRLDKVIYELKLNIFKYTILKK